MVTWVRCSLAGGGSWEGVLGSLPLSAAWALGLCRSEGAVLHLPPPWASSDCIRPCSWSQVGQRFRSRTGFGVPQSWGQIPLQIVQIVNLKIQMKTKICGGNIKWCQCYQKQLAVLDKVKNELLCDSAFLLMGISPNWKQSLEQIFIYPCP